MTWKKAFWSYFIISILFIGFQFKEITDNTFAKIDNTFRLAEKTVDLEILTKCINEGNISKDTLLEILRQNTKYRKRGYQKADTIQANSIKLIYKNEKVIEIQKADTYLSVWR